MVRNGLVFRCIILPNPDLKSAAKAPPPLFEPRTPSDADSESKESKKK